MSVSIILPTYNEKENIIRLIQKIKEAMSRLNLAWEIIVVDDDSPDKTADLVRQKFYPAKAIRVIVRKNKRGLATAVAAGIHAAKKEVIVVMDTDFNHNPKYLPLLIRLLNTCDLAVGSRFVPGGGMENHLRNKLSYLYNCFIRFFLGLKTHDSLSGFFAIRKADLIRVAPKEIFFGFGDYFIRLVYFAHRHGFRIQEIPVYYLLRYHGRRKSNFFSMFTQYTAASIKLWYHYGRIK